MALLIWILVGLVAGSLAHIITGARGCGCIGNIIIGMIGSILGGAIISFLTYRNFDLAYAFNNFSVTSILVSTLGAIILLAIARIVRL